MVLVDLPTEQSAVHAVERIITVLGQPLLHRGQGDLRALQHRHRVRRRPRGRPVTPDQLLRNADAAMYVVKTDGKGRYAVFQPHMHAAALHRLDLGADLQRALDNGEFVLHYQPIVSMTSGLHGRRRGAGAVAAPERGMVRAGRVHPARGGDRPRRASRALGARGRLPAGRDVVGRQPPTLGEHQRVAAPAAPPGVRRRGRLGPRPHRHRAVAASRWRSPRARSWPRWSRRSSGSRCSRASASGWRSTTSAPATRRSPGCASCRSTC